MCEILEDLKMNFETHLDIYLPAGQCWRMIYTLSFYLKQKTSQKKFDANTRDPVRARWDFRGVLDEILLLYLKFSMNKYLKNWGNYEVLRKIGGFIIIVIIICLFALYGILGCAAMILYANLDFYCIDCFILTVANFFKVFSVYIYIFYLFVVCRIF